MFATAESLLEAMDRYHIAEALVHEHNARVVRPREYGNKLLMSTIEGQRRLHPCWVLDPPHKPDTGLCRAMVDEMVESGVRAVRLRMSEIPPLPWAWKEFLSALEERHVPAFADFGYTDPHGGPTDIQVQGLYDMARAHPGLPLILSCIFGGLGVHPTVVPLIYRTTNVYLDIAGIIGYWNEVAVEIGPERVLFCTGMPFTDPGILISNVQYASDLDDEAKRLICGGNLRRLMGGVE